MLGITHLRIETVTKPLLSDVAPCDKSLSSDSPIMSVVIC